MNEQPGVLRNMTPPSGGWERLLARRDVPPRWAQQWLPLVAGGAVSLLLLGMLVPQPKLDVAWPDARGAGAGMDVVPLDQQRVRPLPTDDPRVHLYWMEAVPDVGPQKK
jgi:hypothetical protein